MKQAEPKKLSQEEAVKFLEGLVLKHGQHESPNDGMCVMESVAYVAGEPFSDHPKCASGVLTRFCIRLNDRWGDEERQKLKPFVLRLAGTRAPEAVERRRAYMCADWALREILPLYLDAAELTEWSTKLRALPVVVDPATAEFGRALVSKARTAARALWESKRAAADAAAAYATADAYAAADAAAATATATAAYAVTAATATAAYAVTAATAAYAVTAAAATAAYAAADAAVRAKANASALGLLDRMISLSEPS